jgi:hypothetical protein
VVADESRTQAPATVPQPQEAWDVTTVIVLDCEICGEPNDVVVHQTLGATDLLPEQCQECDAALGPVYESGDWAYV